MPISTSLISPSTARRVTELTRWGKGTIDQIVWSPDGKQLVVASSLGIYFYDAVTLEEIRFIETDAWQSSIAYSLDGKTVASASYDHTVKLWDVA